MLRWRDGNSAVSNSCFRPPKRLHGQACSPFKLRQCCDSCALIARAARTRTPLGVSPNVQRKLRLKCEMSGNPACAAISAILNPAQPGLRRIPAARSSLCKSAREAPFRRLQQLMQIARRHAELRRHSRRVEVGLACTRRDAFNTALSRGPTPRSRTSACVSPRTPSA